MSVADELLALLATEGFGTPRASLFKNRMPGDPDICVAVYEGAGQAPEAGFGVDGILYENPSVQIRVRGVPRDPDTPHGRAHEIFRLIMKQWGNTLSGTEYLTLQPVQSPFVLERDGKDRTIWTFNVQVRKVLS